jgi:glycine cleavage system H protein
MEFPKNLLYTAQHEWVLHESGIAAVGITDYAQNQLGDVVFVELPEVGTTFSKGDSFGVVESVKAASDVYTPVSGEVIEINSELEEHPEYINQSPYGDGWMIKMKISSSDELQDLMSSDTYSEHVQKESEEH